MSWMRFATLALIAFGVFAYSGPAQALVKAVTIVLVAASAAEAVLDRRHKGPTHTELVVGTSPLRLLKSYGALADVLRDRFLHGESELEGSLRSWEQWRFIFFGPPGTGGTIVWSDRHKTMRSDERLIFDMLWQDILKVVGDPIEEPALVFDLAYERGHEVYRMYLRPPPRLQRPDDSGAPKVKPEVLAYFPIALLREAGDVKSEKRQQEIAKLFDLRVVENELDDMEDAFGEPEIYHSEGGPYHVYENDLFNFKVQHFWSGR